MRNCCSVCLSLVTLLCALVLFEPPAFSAPMSAPASAAKNLARGFLHPPNSARPQTWWHWMNGMVTKEGITADLEAMKRVGIGGAEIFNVDQGSPAGPAPFMSRTWRDMIRHAVNEAHRLGLHLTVHNCAGWSSSGGPWVQPKYAMQKVTLSTVDVTGGKPFDGTLPEPPTKDGFYRDIAVLAFPTLGGSKAADTLRISDLRGKAGYVRQDGLTPSDQVRVPSGQAVRQAQIFNLTAQLGENGKLHWQVPPGNWTILRIGYTPTGVTNHPAPAAGRGLEVDKLSRQALDAFFAGMMQTVIDDNRALIGKGLDDALVDSYEVGSQNWTPRFREEFIRRRGYDPVPWLVTLSGRVVNNPAQSERFLWDFRRTIAELFDENYFGYFATLCHQYGLIASVEPYGNGLFNDLTAGSYFDIPMGEFWIGGGAIGTAKIAASIAHTHRGKIAGAESFTASAQAARWQLDPFGLKALGDRAYCLGINRFIFHTYAMQPWLDLAPGMTMGPWGTRFGRSNTWWEQSKAWMKYLARCQYLLQRGRFVADVCYYVGEDSPVSLRVGQPALPPGYDYDALSVEQLLQQLSVHRGRLVLPNGMDYRLLVLPPTQVMTPRVVEKVRHLVADGATVVGPKPVRSPSLANYPACDRLVQQIAGDVWGNCDGRTVTSHTYGKGEVVWGQTLKQTLEALGVPPDFTDSSGPDMRLLYIHRVIRGTDLYFVSNQAAATRTVTCSFRVTGRRPELWHPDTGRIEAAALFTETNGRTEMPLVLDPRGSVFVVFPKSAGIANHLVALEHNGASSLKLQASHNSLRVEIRHAVYGVLKDPQKQVDVTAQVAARVRSGLSQIPASNDLAGDPARNIVKQLRVDYTVNGKPHSVTVREGQAVTLPELGAVRLPAAKPFVGARGSLELQTWEGGTYTATTSSGKTLTVKVARPASPIAIGGPWSLSFPPHLGAPDHITLPKLSSWTESDQAGVKYFSGTATYRKEIDVPLWLFGPGRRIDLDLGKVKNLAQVRVNGHDLGILWKPPFAVDVTRVLKPGRNRLLIKITNLWPNRLIGDEQYPDDCQWNGDHLAAWPKWLLKGESRPSSRRVTFATRKQWHKDDPLLPSGLLGPVSLRQTLIVKLVD